MTEAANLGADKDLPIVDAHRHLWDLNATRYPWLDNANTKNLPERLRTDHPQLYARRLPARFCHAQGYQNSAYGSQMRPRYPSRRNRLNHQIERAKKVFQRHRWPRLVQPGGRERISDGALCSSLDAVDPVQSRHSGSSRKHDPRRGWRCGGAA